MSCRLSTLLGIPTWRLLEWMWNGMSVTYSRWRAAIDHGEQAGSATVGPLHAVCHMT
jgi:hypothetical protein